MGKNILGIDMGGCALKLALCSGSRILRLAEEQMPDNMVSSGRVVSPEAMAEFLKASLKKNRIRSKRAAVILPASQVFVRQTALPAMSDEQLRLNLPYEFRDFISEDRDKYYYDYYVVSTENDSDGKPVKLNILAAATRKELIGQYYDLCRWAGLRLVTAIPVEMALINLIRRGESADSGLTDREQCFIDLGHTGTRVYFFRGDSFDAVRSADRGGVDADIALAAKLNVDEHIARANKEQNSDGVLDSAEIAEVYREVSTDIMRAVNFYGYNNHDSNLSQGWLCGGGGRVEPLCAQLQSALSFALSPVSQLVQGAPEPKLAGVCFAAIGAALQ